MTKKKYVLIIISFISICLTFSYTTNAEVTNTTFESDNISLEQVTKDVTYLASDSLKGRANFSMDLSHAAHYIAERFKENGLIGVNNVVEKSDHKSSLLHYLQTYKVSTITPKTLTLSLNNQAVTADNLAIVSKANLISWQIHNGKQLNNFTLHEVNENDDMRVMLSKLNHQGGNHLVLVNSVHKTLFQGYQHYFKRGVTELTELTGLTNKERNKQLGGTIIIALNNTAIENIKDMTVSAVNSVSNHELANVVAILPGKTKPSEVVLYSAHYDHLGTKTNLDNSTEDTIYNGADDDASGTAAIINIAQYYAEKNDNTRTLMFAAFSAEEIGGFGSQYFSQQIDPKTITAMINIEMIGKPSKFGAGTLWMTGIERSNLGAQLNTALAKQDKMIYKDPYPEQNLFYRSDNATLAKLGVPAHSFSSTQLDKDQHYHQLSDDLSSINLPSLHKVIQTLAFATQPLVDGSVAPTRIDTSKVKAKGLIF